jgi:putative sterol carrier protein
MAMTTPTTEFFDDLGRRGHEPLLESVTGSFRFEITDGGESERWLVVVNRGDVAVSHRNSAADCTLRAPRTLFDAIARGEANAVAAVLRGAVTMDGEWGLLVRFQRLFPSPPRAAAAPGGGGS